MSGNEVFGAVARDYYAKGVPVIPLHKREKRPVPLDWSRYHDHEVEKEVQEEWLAKHAEGNIGVVLGRQSGIVMLDIDTNDEGLIASIKKILPESPWQRVGQNGMVLAYRWSGVRTFRVKNSRGETICEHLSDRTQVVLPPSIHPKTQRPYTANCDLTDVMDQLPTLPDEVEALLRGTLKEAGVELSISGQSGVTDFVSRGSRDISLTEKAGLFAFAVVKGQRTLQEVIGMLRSYDSEFVEKVAGDASEIEKHVDNLLRFLRRDVLEKGRVLPEGWDEGLSEQEKIDMGVDFGVDCEEWSYEELLQHLKDKFEEYQPDSRGRSDAIDHVLVKLAMGSNTSKLEEERLLQYIVDVSEMRLKMTSLRARLRELRESEITGQDHSEIAKKVLADMEQVHTIRKHGGGLWKYTGSHWEKLDVSEVMAKIARDYGHLAASKRHSDHKGIFSTMLNFAEDGICRISKKGVNFANGFLTEDLEFVDHDLDQGMVYTLPFRYMPEFSGKSHQFFDFLETMWGGDVDKADKIAALQEAMCVTLFGMGPRFQRAFLLKGVARSGKSQLLKIAQSLVPVEAKCFVPPNEWSDKFMPSQMHDKLINVCGELSEKKKIDGQRFKDIITGEEMSGQLKGQDIFKFRPECAHWFASNHAPKTEDSSEGFNRRWLMLECTRPVPPDKRQIDIGEKIVAEERESIVAWAVQALGRLKEAGEFTLPVSHKQLIRELAQENNSVRFFMEESPKVQVGAGDSEKPTPRISETKLYNEYWSFCLGPGGARPVGSRGFRAMMRELQHEMGFHLVLERTELGAQEAYYECVTVVQAKKSS